jgi:chorismate dehydratase
VRDDFVSIRPAIITTRSSAITTANKPTRPRVAASSYLNTAPLIWSFQYGTRQHEVELVTDTAPARCADLLANGEAEVALVPVIDYQSMPELKVVPDVCVGSHRAVRSVVLVSKQAELRNARRVVLDTSSRTSQALVKIIFREFLNGEPEWTTSSPHLETMLEGNDAALLIGDPAMNLPEHLHVFDLATLWRRFTGTGFIFAMWMARAGVSEKIIGIDFAGARDEGLANLDDIISRSEAGLSLSPADIREYLTANITFQVDETLAQGLRLYFQLAHKHGLIERNRPLEFLAD